MPKSLKKQGFTLLWDKEAKDRLHRLMALLQKTTPHSVTQSSALQYAVEVTLEKLEPAPAYVPPVAGGWPQTEKLD